MGWKTLLPYIIGASISNAAERVSGDENRILRHRITSRVRLADGERRTVAAMGKQLGKQALAEVVTIVKPDTILASHHQLAVKQFDGSQKRRSPGRRMINTELEALLVSLAQENRSWAYDWIVRSARDHLSVLTTWDEVGVVRLTYSVFYARKKA
jgi:putative transposase